MASFEFEDLHVFHPGSDQVEDATALRANLLRSVAVDLEYLRRHPTPRLYESGVVYGRTKKWLTIPSILKLGYADCKSLAPWRMAEMIFYKENPNVEPTFRWDARPNRQGIKVYGPDAIHDFHVLLRTGVNSYECPSRILGMGQPGRVDPSAMTRSRGFRSDSHFAQPGDNFRLKTNPYPGVYWRPRA